MVVCMLNRVHYDLASLVLSTYEYIVTFTIRRSPMKIKLMKLKSNSGI